MKDKHRTYHGFEKSTYPLPNDREEHNRLDDLQLACRVILGGNIFAPISPDPGNILDVGTGSGAWCVEVANQFPKADVCGLDLSPIRREDTPANCRFVVGDLNEGLKFDDASMDLVNSRFIRAGITKDQWPVHMKEVYRILKPGTGWIQCGEINPRLRCDDGSCPEDAAVFRCQEYIVPKIIEKGIYTNGEFLEGLIKDAGFVDVQVKYVKLYNGTWAYEPRLHEGGRALTRAFAGALDPLIRHLVGPSSFPSEEAMNKLVEDAEADMKNPNYHLYADIHVVTGRKPEAG